MSKLSGLQNRVQMQRRLPAPESLRGDLQSTAERTARKTQTLLSSSSLLGPAVTQPDGWTHTQDTQGLGWGVSRPLPGMCSWLRHSQPCRKAGNNQDPQQAPALPAKRG